MNWKMENLKITIMELILVLFSILHIHECMCNYTHSTSRLITVLLCSHMHPNTLTKWSKCKAPNACFPDYTPKHFFFFETAINFTMKLDKGTLTAINFQIIYTPKHYSPMNNFLFIGDSDKIYSTHIIQTLLQMLILHNLETYNQEFRI